MWILYAVAIVVLGLILALVLVLGVALASLGLWNCFYPMLIEAADNDGLWAGDSFPNAHRGKRHRRETV